MADEISKIEASDGIAYDLCDTAARSSISTVESDLALNTETPTKGLRFTKTGKIVNVYGDLTNLSSSETSVSLGTTTFKSYNLYAIIYCASRVPPYSSPVGTLWVDQSGNVTLYKNSGVTSCYIYGTYICT